MYHLLAILAQGVLRKSMYFGGLLIVNVRMQVLPDVVLACSNGSRLQAAAVPAPGGLCQGAARWHLQPSTLCSLC